MDATVGESISLVFETLPNRLYSIHLIGLSPDCDRDTFHSSLVPKATALLSQKVKCERLRVHFGESKESLSQQLAKEGLVPACLPQCCGGEWAYDRLPDWQDARVRFEWSLPTKKALDHGAAPIPDYSVAPLSQCTPSEHAERKRRLHVLHSRRRRGRMRVETTVMDTQVDELRQSNKRLREENQWLEDRVASANQFLRTHLWSLK